MFANKKALFLVTLLALLMVWAFYHYTPESNINNSHGFGFGLNRGGGMIIDISWPNLNMTEIFGYADFVVAGNVAGISRPQRKNLISTLTSDMYAIYTDYWFKVQEPIKGKINPGERITIRVPGGKIGNFAVESNAVRPDAEKFQVLFLKKSTEYADSHETIYSIITPRGKHVLDQEKGLAINDAHESLDLEFFRRELDKLRQDIRNEVISPPGFSR